MIIRRSGACQPKNRSCLALQRHFRVLTKFAHVESRLSGRKRQRKVVFYAPVNLCDRRPCSTSVAVGLAAWSLSPLLTCPSKPFHYW